MYFIIFWPAEQMLFNNFFWFISQKMEIRENLRYPSLRAKIIYFVKTDFSLQQDKYLYIFLPAEQILFYKIFWFISQKMEIWQNPRYATFRAENIYLVKSQFSLPQDEYFIVFLPAEQILFNKNSWFLS